MLKLPPARILVIDDHRAVVDILAVCLGEEGHTVLSAWTSDEGLKLVTLFQPDLVFLDIALPGMNGIEVLKRIRSINPSTKVVMLTGNIDPSVARTASELESAIRLRRCLPNSSSASGSNGSACGASGTWRSSST